MDLIKAAMDGVEGRSDDIFYFDADQDGGQVTIYPDFIRRCILFVENVEITKSNNILRS